MKYGLRPKLGFKEPSDLSRYPLKKYHLKPSFPHQRPYSSQNYKKGTIIVGYNPLEVEANVKVSCSESVTDRIINELENLNKKYELRVNKALFCEAGEWRSLGSEQEVDDAKVASRRDKVSLVLI